MCQWGGGGGADQGTVAIRDVACAHGKPIGIFWFRGCNVTTERNGLVVVVGTKDSNVSFSIVQSGCIASVRNTPNEGTKY